MVTIRLARGGAKKRPFFGIMVADQRKSPRGRFIERIGFFNPRATGGEESLRIDMERVEYWISKGAKPSDRVSTLLKQFAKGPEALAEEQAKRDAAKEAKKAAQAKAEADALKAKEAEEAQAAKEAEEAAAAEAEAEAAPEEAPAEEAASEAEEAPAEGEEAAEQFYRVYIELGKVVGVWGVKGWIKLHSYTRNRADISNYFNWWLQSSKNDNHTLFKVLNCREQGQGVVAQLDGVTDRDQAMALNGQRIFVKEAELPELPEGEFYWQQLIGLTVSNNEQAIGVIDSILETGANDVLVIKQDDAADVLVPYIDSVVQQVDIAQGTMLVDWDPAYLSD